MCMICLLSQCFEGMAVSKYISSRSLKLHMCINKYFIFIWFILGHVALLVTEILRQDQNFLNTPRSIHDVVWMSVFCVEF